MITKRVFIGARSEGTTHSIKTTIGAIVVLLSWILALPGMSVAADDHFWTDDFNGEHLPREGWNFEGPIGYLMRDPSYDPSFQSAVAFYRFRDTNGDSHFWTVDPKGEGLDPSVWKNEGPVGYVLPGSSMDPKTGLSTLDTCAIALWRFTDDRGSHFWTSDKSGEVLQNPPWHVELPLPAGYIFKYPNCTHLRSGGIKPFYRFNRVPGAQLPPPYPRPGDTHFYSTQLDGGGLSTTDWHLEGPVGLVVPQPSPLYPEAVPVFRWYKAKGDKHFWTTDPNGEALDKNYYIFEKIDFYVFPRPQPPKTIPIYRWASEADVFWTADIAGESLPQPLWQNEGIAGFIFKDGPVTPGLTQLYRFNRKAPAPSP